MNEKMIEAQRLYFTEFLTQRDIAARVGVTERTIYNWIRQYAWDKLKQASLQAPAMIAESLCSQLVELQAAIAARKPGTRFPTPQEAETQRKLIASIEKTKKSPTLGQSMQLFRLFNDWVSKKNGTKDFCWDLGYWYSKFLEKQAQNGYAPYEMEYGAGSISPLSPWFASNPETGNIFPEETVVDNHPQTITPAASQPLPVLPEQPETTGNSGTSFAAVSGLGNELLQEHSNTIPKHEAQAFEQFAQQVFHSETGNIFPEETNVDNQPETIAPAAFQPLPVPHAQPETTGNSRTSLAAFSGLVNEFLQENRNTIPKPQAQTFEQFAQQVFHSGTGNISPAENNVDTPPETIAPAASQPLPAPPAQPETTGNTDTSFATGKPSKLILRKMTPSPAKTVAPPFPTGKTG